MAKLTSTKIGGKRYAAPLLAESKTEFSIGWSSMDGVELGLTLRSDDRTYNLRLNDQDIVRLQAYLTKNNEFIEHHLKEAQVDSEHYERLIVQIPKPRFKRGDFVRYTRMRGSEGFVAIVRIENVTLNGRFTASLLTSPLLEVEDASYITTAQDGCLTIGGTPIRPGSCLVPGIEELDDYGELIVYDGTVWTPDTMENLTQRCDNWKRVYPE